LSESAKKGQDWTRQRGGNPQKISMPFFGQECRPEIGGGKEEGFGGTAHLKKRGAVTEETNSFRGKGSRSSVFYHVCPGGKKKRRP